MNPAGQESRCGPIDIGCIQAHSLRQCRQTAIRRVAQGCYDGATLACFRQAARLGGAHDLLAYLSFRRDLGEALGPHHVRLLRGIMPGLGLRGRLGALNLIYEATGQGDTSSWSAGPITRYLLPYSPVLTAHLLGEGRIRATPFHSGLAALIAVQEARRADLVREIQAAARICVVGNHGGLRGAGLGQRIDAHDLVIRFNQYNSVHTHHADTGSRTDIWVRAPGFRPEGIEFQGRWLVVSGPDLRFRLTDWRCLKDQIERATPLVTVPLDPWRTLVHRLKAPPSAGLLMLAWLRGMRPRGLQGVGIAGFQQTGSAPPRYHHALPKHQAGERHDWPAEAVLLAEWEKEDGAVRLSRDTS